MTDVLLISGKILLTIAVHGYRYSLLYTWGLNFIPVYFIGVGSDALFLLVLQLSLLFLPLR